MNASTIKLLETLFESGTVSGAPDWLLLEQFVAAGDAFAFEAIVARHGPMVFDVCGRVLREQSDVEDAFQATFLILVRKAATLCHRDRLGSWLYGVANRVARRARAQRIRHRFRETLADAGTWYTDSCAEAEHRELLAILDEELSRLAEKHRAAIVLCDLEGLTYEAAARNLNCPLGTLKTRLTVGRKRLRERLIRPGITPAAAAIALSLAVDSASASVPTKLSAATVAAALRSIVACASAGGAAATSVSALTAGALKAMWLSRIKVVGVVGFIAIATSTMAIYVFAQQPGGSKYDEQIRQLEDRLRFLKDIRRREAELALERVNTGALQAKTADKLRKLGANVDRERRLD
jgi:RNA polymerase sigma factor (sigma-70 family)